MRWLLAAICMLLYAATCFAESSKNKTVVKESPIRIQAVSVLRGTICSVVPGDAAKGSEPEITVADEAGKLFKFLIKPTTTIYDTDFKAIKLAGLGKDAGVKIKYTTTKEGDLEAVSVSELKVLNP